MSDVGSVMKGFQSLPAHEHSTVQHLWTCNKVCLRDLLTSNSCKAKCLTKFSFSTNDRPAPPGVYSLYHWDTSNPSTNLQESSRYGHAVQMQRDVAFK